MFCQQCGTENPAGAQFCASCGAQQVATPNITASVQDVIYAGFWYRLLASVIDQVLLLIVTAILAIPIGIVLGIAMAQTATIEEVETAAAGIGNLLSIVLAWLWFTIPESSGWQASVGKKMLGLKVTDEHGQKIGFGRANARYWSKILSTLIMLIGFLMIAFTRRKQGLHDLIARTLVVKGS